MPNQKFDLIKSEFIKYLDSCGLSPKSHKNYRSDLSHFTGWLILKVRSFGAFIESLTEAIPFIGTGTATEYKKYMIENKFPAKTINRRLSTLRHLSRYLLSSQNVEMDFMEDIENISGANKAKTSVIPLISEFRSYLESEKISKNTIKNYLSDINQFMTWIESNNQINSSKLPN